MDVLSTLRGFPFFSKLADELLRRLADMGRPRLLPMGSVVFRQGDAPDGLYVIMAGSVRVSLTDEAGQPIELATLTVGAVFGEMALLDGQPRSASVTCHEDCEFLLLERQDYLPFLKSSDALLESILSDLSRRVRGVQEKFYLEMLQRQRVHSEMELERHRALSQMVAGVAHEVNTPLGIITSAASVIRELLDSVSGLTQSGGLPSGVQPMLDDVSEAARLIEGNVARASKLVQRFKSLSARQAASSRETLSIADCLSDTIELYAIHGRRVGMQVLFHNHLGGSPLWHGAPAELSQILLNLLTNAERYAYPTGVGGPVDVELSDESAGNRQFVLRVRDQGGGIPAEHQSRVFEPFFTTGRPQGGTGLGLAIVYNLVRDSLGGSVELRSQPGNTEFLIRLPIGLLTTSESMPPPAPGNH